MDDEVETKKDIIAHNVRKFSIVDIPWEYGTNKYASQKGMSPFGGSRGVVSKVTGAKSFTDVDNESIPKLAAGCRKADMKTMPVVGGTRENVRTIELNNKATVAMNDVLTSESGTFLSRWMQPNPNANNAEIGRRRDATTEVIGKGRHDRRGEAVLPKLQDTSRLVTCAGTGAGNQGYHNQRQVTTKVEGSMEMSYDDEIKSKSILPWTTGYQNPQSQSRTGGFSKPRDVVNQTYYDTKKPMTSYRFH